MIRRIKLLLQHLAPQKALSHLAKVLSECRVRWWKNWQIRYLIRRYGADISVAEFDDPDDYPTFNAFFTRRLKPHARPIVAGPQHVISPVDGCISQIGRIEQDTLLQAKGRTFSLTALLGGSAAHAEAFVHGHYATLYLAPPDYHRVHMPYTGMLRDTLYIPGKLFSVNPLTAENVDALFARNERLVCLFETTLGPMAVILVGAMLVSGLHTSWAGPIVKTSSQQSVHYHHPIALQRGDELGHFSMGSTVVLLFSDNGLVWDETLKPAQKIKMGQSMGAV